MDDDDATLTHDDNPDDDAALTHQHDAIITSAPIPIPIPFPTASASSTTHVSITTIPTATSSPHLQLGIGTGPSPFASPYDTTATSRTNLLVGSTTSMISTTAPADLLPTEPITTRFQQYLFNPQAPTPPKGSLNNDDELTRHSVTDDLYSLNRYLMDDNNHHSTTATTAAAVATAAMQISSAIDAASSAGMLSTGPTVASAVDNSSMPSIQFSTTPSFSAPSAAVTTTQPASHLSSATGPSSSTMQTSSIYPMSCGASFTAPSTSTAANPIYPYTASNVTSPALSSSSLYPTTIDTIMTTGTVVSDISMAIPMTDASFIPETRTRMAGSSSQPMFGASSPSMRVSPRQPMFGTSSPSAMLTSPTQAMFGSSSAAMTMSSTQSAFSSPSITTTTGAGPSSLPRSIVAFPTISPEARLAASEMVKYFMQHISVQGSESDRMSMSGLIKNAIPVRGVKMLRIRYELHSWWNEYKRHHHNNAPPGPPAIDVQKMFAFQLLASEWFEDKLAAVLFMQEVLLANQNLGVGDLQAFEAAFAADHVRVYKVCDHLTDKVLFHIAHRASALTQERKNAIEKLFEWTQASDMWQSRAALCTLAQFADNEELRDRILNAAMMIMKRSEDEAKSAAGAALRELSKFEMKKVLNVLKQPDNIAATSVIALKKACTNLPDSTEKELKEWRKDVIARRRSR